mgnify:CR=1 FL=1
MYNHELVLVLFTWRYSGLYKVGGYEEMLQQYRVAVSTPETLLNNNTCGEAPENFNHIFRPASDPNYPWPGVLIGANILSYWYFCTDQVRDGQLQIRDGQLQVAVL